MNSYSFKNSILEGSMEPIDSLSPATFITWFNQKNLVTSNTSELLKEYRQYVIAWSEFKNLSKAENDKTITDSYIQILRETAINFYTEEEKRFISNLDYTNETDLDIAIPFFLKKIKQVCLFYANERHKLKQKIFSNKRRGNTKNISDIIKNIVFEAAATANLTNNEVSNNFPPLSALANQLDVYSQELYDLKGNYFNISPDQSTNFNTYSSANINDIDTNLYINFKQAIINAIKFYPFVINSLGTNNFTIDPVLSGTELYYLKNRDFIDYLSGGEESLKLNTLKLLAPKYLGNDFYYLSTGSTATNFVSGLLFNTKPLTGATVLNLLNRQYPSTATVPSLCALYSDYEIGRFFLPQHKGVLIYNTPYKKYVIDKNILEPFKVYAFPDPDVVGNVSYNSDTDKALVPISYTIDVSWNRITRSNQFSFGDVLSNNYNQLFYSYQSQTQDLQRDTSGLSRVIDNTDFWTGNKKQFWANSDIWPGLNQRDTLPIDERQATLLVGEKELTHYGSDIFGNDIGLYKNSPNPISLTAPLFDGSIIPDSYTRVLTTQKIDSSIFDKKYKNFGTVYVRNNFSSIVSPFSAALSAVYFKYPDEVKNEIDNKVIYLSVYYDTLILETKTYVIIDSYNYNFDNGNLESLTPAIYYKKDLSVNGRLEIFVGEWFDENENQLYLLFLGNLPSLSATNFRSLYPKIYKTSLKSISPKLIYPGLNTDIFNTYSLSGITDVNVLPQINLFKIDGASFSKDIRKNLFNLTYLGKNLNDIPFIVNEQLINLSNTLQSNIPVLYKPYYFVYDNNYSNPELQYVVRYNGSSSGNMGVHDYSSQIFDVGQFNSNYINYVYVDETAPLILNRTGVYIIQFDWESYPSIPIFIGCNYYKISLVENEIVFNSGTINAKQITGLNNIISAGYIPVTASDFNTYNINILVERVTYPDPSLLKITLNSNPENYNENICDELPTIYRNLNVKVAGTGGGLVFADPYCVKCYDECMYEIPVNTTLTMIASADKISRFQYWTGMGCASSKSCIIDLTNNSSVTAFFLELPFYTLKVSPQGFFNGGISKTKIGTVWCNELDIFCGDGCEAQFREGTLITLSANAPLSGWFFTGFEGGDCAGYTDPICSFFITYNQNISANFVRVFDFTTTVTVTSVSADNSQYGRIINLSDYRLDVSARETKTAIFTGTGYGDFYEVVLLSALPAKGYFLRSLSGTNCNILNPVGYDYLTPAVPIDSIVNTCLYGSAENNTVTATFDRGYYALTVVPSGIGIGYAQTYINDPNYPIQIDCSNFSLCADSNVCKYYFLSGTTVNLYASAFENNSVRGIYSVDCTGDGLSSCTFKMDDDKTVVINFESGLNRLLTVVNTSNIGLVSSYPTGIDCLSGTGDCISPFTYGDVVTLCASKDFNKFDTFFGPGVLYTYNIGGGLRVTFGGVTTTNLVLPFNSQLSLTDSSLIITDPVSGAPYLSAAGINITPNTTVGVYMTENRTVSAKMYKRIN